MSDQSNPTIQDLYQKRERINEIDAGILSLLHERMKLAVEISEIKRQTGKDIDDLEREEELLKSLIDKNTDTLIPNEDLLLIWGKIIELSKRIQEREPQ